jgi:hypothetical protein
MKGFAPVNMHRAGPTLAVVTALLNPVSPICSRGVRQAGSYQRPARLDRLAR